MLNILEATKEQYRSDNVHKEVEIRIPSADLVLHNEDIVAESINLTESIESTNNLSFTGCIASVFKFSCVNLIQDVVGAYVEADIIADDTEETIPLFRGYIDEVTNPSHEEITTSVIAYDTLYKISDTDVSSWYNALTFPISIKNFRDSLCSRLGLTQVEDYLPNDSITIQKTIEDKSISGLTLLKYVCQINGRFGQIGRDGKLIYRHLVEGTEALYPREDLYPDDNIFPADENALESVNKAHYKKIEFENYTVNTITKVQLVNKEGSISARAGSGSNAYTVQNNPLIYGLGSSTLDSIALNLYNTIKGLWYVPTKVESIGLPYVECGDFVLMAARYSIVRAYVLTRTLSGIQSLNDQYEAKGSLNQPIYKPNIDQKIAANSEAISKETTNRISAVSAEASARSSAISAEASARASGDSINAQAIQAETVRAKNVEATKATIQQLNATNATIGTLSAQVANVNNLVAQKANISDLNATNANVSNLSAQVANVNNLVAQKASIAELNAVKATVNYISATYVTASQVNTAVHSAMEGSITTGTLRANQIYIYDGGGYISLNQYVHRYA